MEWPEPLVESLVDRRAIIFIGSGASSGSESVRQESLPDWKKLLNMLAEKLTSGDRVAYDRLMSSNKYTQAAQVIVDSTENAAIRRAMIQIFDNSAIIPGPIYEYINLLDQPVVMTTNYDKLYERYWDQLAAEQAKRGGERTSPLVVRDYTQDGIVASLRERSRLYLKLHGCVSRPENLVLSRSQYYEAKYRYKNFFDVVSALVLTRTVFFVGLGFGGDPDIDSILDDAAFIAGSDQPHYALIPSGRHPSEIRSLRSLSNVQAIEYDVIEPDNHSNALQAMEHLVTQVTDRRNAE